MARRAGRDEVYEVAERFVEEALEKNGSLFTPGKVIWSAENIEDLYERFEGNPGDAPDGFEDRLRRQLGGVPPEARQLAAELLYIYLTFPSKFGGDKKRRIIHGVLDGQGVEGRRAGRYCRFPSTSCRRMVGTEKRSTPEYGRTHEESLETHKSAQ